MNKLLVVTALVALLALSAEGIRGPRQAEEEEEQGTLSVVSHTIKDYYDYSVSTASGYLQGLRELQLEDKARSLYDETTKAVGTYFGILQDQLYHIFYHQD